MVNQFRSVSDALELYRQDNGNYPTSEEGTTVLYTEGYAGTKYISLDSWGTPLVYEVVDGVPHVYSIGANKRDENGFGDDIVMER